MFVDAGARFVLTWALHFPAVLQGVLPCLVLVHHHKVVIIAEKRKLCGACFAVKLLIYRIKRATVGVEGLSLGPVSEVRLLIPDPTPGLTSFSVQPDPASRLQFACVIHGDGGQVTVTLITAGIRSRVPVFSLGMIFNLVHFCTEEWMCTWTSHTVPL